MTWCTYPPVDNEQMRMQEAYALAHHALHQGESGTFRFYRWGKYYKIVVDKGRLTSTRVGAGE